MKRQPAEREAHLLPDRYVIASRVEPELRRRCCWRTRRC
jgi:hypothetical protein